MRCDALVILLFLFAYPISLRAADSSATVENPQGTSPDCSAKFDAAGRRQTLNQTGYESRRWDLVSRAFVDFAEDPACPRQVFLDVGAAYGRAVIAAAEKGAMVFANDLDDRHLAEMRRELPAAVRNRIVSYVGSFPEEFSVFHLRFGAIRLSRVLHFFDGPRVGEALRRSFELLLPGGKIFIVTATPRVALFQSFLPTFEANKKMGVAWPGLIHDIATIDPELLDRYPRTLHLFDPDTMTAEVKRAGFEVESAQWLTNPDMPPEQVFDGKELMGLIARRPLEKK